MSIEKEIQEIQEYLSQAEGWKKRRAEIEEELNKMWTDDGELEPLSYQEEEYKDKEDEENDDRVVIEIQEASKEDNTVQETGRIVGEVDDELSQDNVEKSREITSESMNNKINDE